MRQAGSVKRTATTAKPASKNRIESPLSTSITSKEDFYKKVEETAYHLYVARGGTHGYDVEDWLAAEQIVKGS